MRTTLAVAAVGGMPRLTTWAKPEGANGDIRVAIVGFNGRGGSHISGFSSVPGVRVVALCDVDSAVLERGAKQMEKRGQKVATYTDVRKLLESKEIDAVSTATPNHWHALITVWACQAGKDVYVEKPVSHNVWEGRQAVRAAERYGRIVQAGTQCRSSGAIAAGIQFVREGGLGKVKVARGLCYKRRASIGKATGEQPIPPGIDYDLWCGPAPKEPLRRLRLHYDWHWVWPTGNGDLGNQGVHQMDLCRWALGADALAPRVLSVGGRFGYDDDGETPNTQMVVHAYDDAFLTFEVRGLPARKDAKEMDKFNGASIGCLIECEQGTLVIPSYSEAIVQDRAGKVVKTFKDGDNNKKKKGEGGDGQLTKDGKVVMRFSVDDSHFGNFIRAMRSRKPSDLKGPIVEGHISSALCHAANISHLVGVKAAPGEILERIRGEKESASTFERMRAHLEANGVDLLSDRAILGAMLKIDPKTERFEGNDAANALLTRNYRAPYIVPEVA